jgi:hypothetical protein
MSSTSQRYPLSTPEGVAIPFEIIKPHSYLKKSFTAGSASSAVAVPADVEILIFSSNEDCIVKFGGTASVPADGVSQADVICVEKDVRIAVAPNADTFTIIGETVAGALRVQFIQKWAGLAVTTQYKKR